MKKGLFKVKKKLTLRLFWNVLKTFLKIIVYFGITIVLIRYYDYQTNYDKYLTFSTRDGGIITKVKIPEDIVNAKSYEKFYEWQKQEVPPSFYYHACPWAKNTPIRDICIDGTWLSIPRKYMYGIDKNAPNGNGNKVCFDFRFPSLEPGYSNDDSVSVSIQHAVKGYDKYGMIMNQYNHFLGIAIDPLYTKREKVDYKIIPLGYNKDLERKEY